MSHPFQVGSVYRNRVGAYRVVSIDEPKMTVCYSDGKLLQGDVVTFARIWENLQAESNPAEPKVTVDSTPPITRPRNGKRGKMFGGLTDHDFKNGVTGTEWRARESLGGLLAQRLSDILGTPFESFAIYRRAEVYITREGRYTNNKAKGTHHAKFFFALSPEGARYGFYVERDQVEMDETWDWHRFIAGMRTQDGALQDVAAFMHDHRVVGEAHLWINDQSDCIPGRLIVRDDGLAWAASDRATPATISWPQCAERLASLDARQWCDLYFYAAVNKAEAIGLGDGIAERAIKIYLGLLPLYAMSLR